MKALIAQKFIGKKPQKKAYPQIHATPPHILVIISQTVARCLTKVNHIFYKLIHAFAPILGLLKRI